MSDSTLPGERLREIRLARGLTQEGLAEKSGLSVPTVKKIEQGRGAARVETYHALARALRVRTSALFDTGGGGQRRRIDTDRDRLDLMPLRQAIAPPMGAGGTISIEPAVEDEPDLRRISTTGRALDQAYHRDDYVTVAELLPALIRSAHVAVGHFDGGPEQTEALRLRADVLQQAGRYLTQLRVYDLAHLALRDALRDAAAAGDQLSGGAAVYLQGWVLMREARLDEAERLTASTAEAIEPRLSRASRDELGVWGRLLLKSSAAAARNNRPDAARELLQVARAAGATLGTGTGGGSYRSGSFNALSPAYQAIENYMVSDRPDRVLGLSERIQIADASTSNTKHRHLLDVAAAHVLVRQDSEAEGVLAGLHQESPDWLRHQQFAADTFTAVLRKRRRVTARQRKLAEFFALA